MPERPGSGWTPGERQYATGPALFTSDIVAPHSPAKPGPTTAATWFAIACVISWTAFAGLDASSRMLKWICRPRIPPVRLT